MADFSAPVARVVQSACTEAQKQQSPVVGTPHLFIALTKLDGEAVAALRGQGHDPRFIRDGLRAALGSGQAALAVRPKLTACAAQNLRRAQELAVPSVSAQVVECHLLTAILEDDPASHATRPVQPERGSGCIAIERACGGHADFVPSRPRPFQAAQASQRETLNRTLL